MARKKMAAPLKKAVKAVVKSAHKRRAAGKKIKFNTDEKSTLRHVMTTHNGKRNKKAAAKRKYTKFIDNTSGLLKKVKATKTAKKTPGKRGRKAGFHHSAATIAKMRKAHLARWAAKKGKRKVKAKTKTKLTSWHKKHPWSYKKTPAKSKTHIRTRGAGF